MSEKEMTESKPDATAEMSEPEGAPDTGAMPVGGRPSLSALARAHRGPVTAAACGVAALAIAAGLALSGGPTPPTTPEATPEAQQAALTEEEDVAVSVPVTVEAEGWTDDSTPAIAHVTSSDGSVDYYHAVTASEAASGATVDLAPGDYQVSWVSPINADGSIYQVPEAQEITVVAQAPETSDGAAQAEATASDAAEPSGENQATDANEADDAQQGDSAPAEAAGVVTDKDAGVADGQAYGESTQGDLGDAPADGGTSAQQPAIDAPLAPVPADQVTTDQMQQVVDQIGEAVSKGDATLSGEAGQGVVSKAAENSQAASNVDHDAVNESVSGAAGRVEEAPSAEAPKTKQAQKPKSEPDATQERPKTWVAEQGHSEPTYSQIWVQDSAAWDETVVDQAAWDEPVYESQPVYDTKSYYLCTDGYRTESDADLYAHTKEVNMAGGNVNYSVEYENVQTGTKRVQTGTKHHDAVTHVVHHDATGHYENKQTGTRWVVDVPGHWE